MTESLPTAPSHRAAPALSMLDTLAAIPEEEVWLASQKSARTRRAYRLDVRHFMATLGITTTDALRQVDHRAVIAWERIMREGEHCAPSTIRRRLAALSSLFKHLVRHGTASRNPVAEVARPTINRDEGSTLAFSKAQARKLLDAPAADTLAGARDRAILSVGLQVGLRRAEIAALTVDDLHQNRGFDALRLTRKGGRRDALAINPQTAPAPARLSGTGRARRPTRTGRCSGRCAATSTRAPRVARWTPTPSTGWCGNMPAGLASRAATRRIRCGRPSSPRRWKTARSSKTCRRPPGIATRAPPSSMTGAAITPKKPQAFSRLTRQDASICILFQNKRPELDNERCRN